MDQLQLQPSINIGTLGSIAHGKSTLIKKLTGVTTMKHSSELQRGITIKLGYANMKIWQCPQCPRPKCYSSTASSVMVSTCQHCSTNQTLVRHISFVDCPGHEVLMATMLNGVAMMDGAIFVIAGNESCPQPQTREHLISADIMCQNLRRNGRTLPMICVQTKVDLITQQMAHDHYQQIKTFVKETCADRCPIIPICSHLGYNLDVLLEYLVRTIPEPTPQPSITETRPPRVMVIRSFDINKPGSHIPALQGGVLGGTLRCGKIRRGDRLELRPGLIVRHDGDFKCYPLQFNVVSLMSEQNSLDEATPGGLIAIGTTLDPGLTKNDRLIGSVLGHIGQLPPIYRTIQITHQLMRQISLPGDEKAKVLKPKVEERLRLNVNSITTSGRIGAIHEKELIITLDSPVCLDVGDSVTLSRSYNNRWRLIGCGVVNGGIPEPTYEFKHHCQ
jgi:translation initiation factor 2 subunit 3